MPRHTSRGPSPVYYQMPNGDVPPVPPVPALYIQHNPAVEQARKLDRSVKGSVSSQSTNMRTDSDTPSTDLPLPPTPRDGMSVDALVGPPGNRMMRRPTTNVARGNSSSSRLYYDYSEPFEHEEFVEYDEPILTDFSNQPKTVSKERNNIITPTESRNVSSGTKPAEVEQSELPGIAELPASPVGRRITRDLIRGALDPASTTGDIVSSTGSPAARGDIDADCCSQGRVVASPVNDKIGGSSMLPIVPQEECHSVLSQTGSSIPNSSTLHIAVKHSILAMTGTGSGKIPIRESKSVSASSGSPEKSTEDGMSELLAGYQHTDSKQEGGVSLNAATEHDMESVAYTSSGRRSSHAKNSSDIQSFKSCTDVPVPITPDPSKDGDTKPCKTYVELSSKPRPLVKEPEARLVDTYKDGTTPGQTSSVPPPRLPSTISTDAEVHAEKLASGLHLSTPPRRKGSNVFARHASSFSLVASKLRGSAKPSIKQGSVSVSGSSSTLSATQQPPLVPPRESSASKEAQRVNAVGSYLLRCVVPSRLPKEKKVVPDEEVTAKNSIDTTTSQPMQYEEKLVEPISVPQQPDGISKTPEKALAKQDVVSEQQKSSKSIDYYSPTKPLHVGIALVPALHQHSFSSPTTAIPSLFSTSFPQGMSMKNRVQSSPAGVPILPEYSRRDSQTTTHLSWGGRRPFSNASASASEPYLPLPGLQEDSTTDLRLSGYRYNGPQGYLPDLKEESHEDLSLNTSASNLKNYQFRFPYGSGPGMRTSADDAVFFSGKSSTRSRRRSAIEEAHNLPSMEFSQANLFDKLRDVLGDIRFSQCSDRPGGPEGSLQGCTVVGERGKEAQNSVNSESEHGGMVGQDQRTVVIGLAKLKRLSSCKKLMTEIDQLSIPSVTQLTQRFTEMLPSLSLGGYHNQSEQIEPGEFLEEEEMIEHAIEEIHHVHPPSQKRSSARLRPVRGSSALMVIDDDVFEEVTRREMDNACSGGESAGEPEFETEISEAGTRAQVKDKNAIHTLTHQLSTIAELRAPSPTTSNPLSKIDSDQILRSSVEIGLSATRSPRSFVSSPSATDTRPWNFDRNYPWATTTVPSVDISLPLPTATRQSSYPGPSHLRNTLSDATTSTFTSDRTPIDSPTGNASNFHFKHQSHRLGIFGRNGDQTHPVGERYPTSALSPPTAIFRDHLSTCDISDDEDFTTSRKPKLTLRKRFSSATRNNTVTHNTPRVDRTKFSPTELASPASAYENASSTLQDRAGEARAFTSNRHTFRDAEGMRSSAYHCHRLVDSVKRWWHKGGDLIRTISRRSNRKDVSDSTGH